MIQVSREHTEEVLAQFAGAGIETCGVIARPRYDDQVRVTLFEEPLLETTRLLAQRTWSETSYRMQHCATMPNVPRTSSTACSTAATPALGVAHLRCR